MTLVGVDTAFCTPRESRDGRQGPYHALVVLLRAHWQGRSKLAVLPLVTHHSSVSILQLSRSPYTSSIARLPLLFSGIIVVTPKEHLVCSRSLLMAACHKQLVDSSIGSRHCCGRQTARRPTDSLSALPLRQASAGTKRW